MNTTARQQQARNRSLLLLPIVGLLAVLPLLWHGCSCGHDFDFHLQSWFDAATQLRYGTLHPQWAFSPAFNAGEPRFVFYPPLSWTLGAVLGLVLPWSITPIVYTWLALTAAGLSCYWLLREFVAPRTALLVAALYMVNPYMLFTAYERTAYAELMAAAWLPLLLRGVLQRRITIAPIAIPVALLWITNAPAAVIGCYGLAILAAVRLLLTLIRREAGVSAARLIRNTAGGTALGIGLAAFYIVPAAYERRYVEIKMAMVEGMRITDNYLFHHTPNPDHDAVLRTASLLAVSLLSATVLALLVAFVRAHQSTHHADHERRTLYALTTVTITIALLLLPVSNPVWQHAPELMFLQFPWRFLALLMPVLALALAIAAAPIGRLKGWMALTVTAVFVAALILTSYRAFQQPCDPEDTVAARLALYREGKGPEPTDEYTPITADNDALGHANPPWWLVPASDPQAPPPAATVGRPAGPLQLPLILTSSGKQILVLNRRAYPNWQLSVNGAIIQPSEARDDGLIALAVPEGRLRIDLHYLWGRDRQTGDAITAVSLVLLLLLLLPLRHRRAQHDRQSLLSRDSRG